MEKLESLVTLCHRRWNMPVLALLGQLEGAKFVTLANQLGVSRVSLSQSLKALIAAGWVKRNPGYGHPLRPEYVLTAEGKRKARDCGELWAYIEEQNLQAFAAKKWSLPVLAAIHSGAQRFSRIKDFLPEATSRAMTQALKNASAEGLITREVTADYPPASVYLLTNKAERLSHQIERFLAT
jgi:DNA-binding HxlR family transcriptional regulator